MSENSLWYKQTSDLFPISIEKITDNIINEIKLYFKYHAGNCNKAIIGISGGKDSYVTAALLKEAIGSNNIYAISLPDVSQKDIEDAEFVVKDLGIKEYFVHDISNGKKEYIEYILKNNPYNTDVSINNITIKNLAAKFRMMTFFTYAGINHYRVISASNFSELYAGYFVKSETCYDYYPISDLLVSQVIKIGKYMGLSDSILDKTPSDGICGLSDEDNLGFTYDQLEQYIFEVICFNNNLKKEYINHYNGVLNLDIFNKIRNTVNNSKHKLFGKSELYLRQPSEITKNIFGLK